MSTVKFFSDPGNGNLGSGNHNPIRITDAAMITALGDNLQETWRQILRGVTAVRPVSRFPVDNYSSRLAACIEDLKPSGGRSMTHALVDRLFGDMGPVPPDAFLITATTKAGIDNLELLCRGYPAHAQDILLSSIPDMISEKLGMRAGGTNISASCASSTVALARGAGLIAQRKTEAVLVCCVDLVTEFIFSGFSALKALSPFPCRPFDRDRQGLSVGEGAAALLLMSEERAKREDRPPLGTIQGWGMANDASHITAPAKSGRGLVQAISQALRRAQKQPEEISAINAHGTATPLNDLSETKAIKTTFGDQAYHIPVSSTKSMTGHMMGATGALEAIFCVYAVQEDIIPPTIHYQNRDPQCDLDYVPNQARALKVRVALSNSFGFGGHNAVLIVKEYRG